MEGARLKGMYVGSRLGANDGKSDGIDVGVSEGIPDGVEVGNDEIAIVSSSVGKLVVGNSDAVFTSEASSDGFSVLFLLFGGGSVDSDPFGNVLWRILVPKHSFPEACIAVFVQSKSRHSKKV
jgi:hypothetical protein